jgi:hypothetical protein
MNGTGGTELCMTTKVGGEGLNLHRANRIIILDPHWNPTLDTQACFRVYRIGQLKEVTILRLICRDGDEFPIEERIYRRAAHKTSAACRIVSEADVERLYTKEQLYTHDGYNEDCLNMMQLKDPVLRTVFDDLYSISQHDLLFAEAKHEKLTNKELADAYNTFHGMAYLSEFRTITHPISQVQHTVGKDDVFFPKGDDDDVTFVTPATPIWKRRSTGFQLGDFIPSETTIDKYITELETSVNGKVTTKQEEAFNNKLGNVKIPTNSACRLRIKFVIQDKESEWSDWSAYMYA